MKKPRELIVDGKPMSEWAENNGWIQIGSWQVDPSQLSLKFIDNIIEWETNQAKLDALNEVENLWVEGATWDGILSEIQRLKTKYTPKNTLPGESYD